MPSSLLLGTTNKGKIKEFQALLAGLDVQIFTPHDFNIDPKVAETGQTYRENAAIKADFYTKLTGIMTLADDSGLEVDPLKGAPGLRSARYAPQTNATDMDRRSYLIEKLRPFPQPWTARFRCVIALAEPKGKLFFGEGLCEGRIISEERGSKGFGYDPIFLLEPRGVTMAELSRDEKNQISHRAIAVKNIRPTLEILLRKVSHE